MDDPPTEAALRSYYQDKYWSGRSGYVEGVVAVDGEYQVDSRAKAQIDLVLEMMDCPRVLEVLEIGAGAALASLLLRDRCSGSRVNLNVCEPGQQWESYYRRHGISKASDYFPFETTKRFTYVHTSHWLEHVGDLDGTLTKINGMMEESGYLFVEVPNTEHFYWGLRDAKDAPHLHFFTVRSLTRALQNNGFRCLLIGEYGPTRIEHVKGGSVPDARQGPHEKGRYVRGLFQKSN